MNYPEKLQPVFNFFKRFKLPFKVTFILMGIVSTAWFLIRVIPKPGRAAYPCMHAAAPVMSGFVVYLLGLSVSALIFKKLREYIRKARFITAGIMLVAGLTTLGFLVTRNSLKARADAKIHLAVHTPNEPMGEASGIYSGRVVWAWNPDATNENCIPTNYGDGWWMEKNNNQTIVDQMMHDAILKLTGESTVASAWDTLFRFHNNKKYGTNNPYTPGEKILIKINITSAWGAGESWGNMYPGFNKNENSYYGIAETSPQVVLSIFRQLINEAGVSQSDIYVGDPMKNIYTHAYNYWHAEFPDINYLGNYIHYNKFTEDFLVENGRTPVVEGSDVIINYSDPATISEIDLTYTIVEQADYMINIPALKAHKRAGITLTAKNHFGTQSRNGAGHLHAGLVAPDEEYPPTRTSYGMYRTQVDLMGHPYLGGNTMLFVVDGLWGGSEAVNPPTKWDMTPFNGDWTSSVFMSQDQVALESVCFDFLRTEYDGTGDKVNYPNYEGVDDYLRQAADPSKWPAGITYMPDGEHPLTSLGIHEHWNNPTSKQYSRNLGLKEGIQLLSIPEELVLSSENHEVITGMPGGIKNAYPNPFPENTTIEYQVTAQATVEIDVVNIYGQEIKNLLNKSQLPGSYSVIWDGRDENSGLLPTGIYIIRMKSYTNTGLKTHSRQVQILRF